MLMLLLAFGLLASAGSILPRVSASGAPASIYFQCIYLDNALNFLGSSPSLAPANPAENPSWCCGLDLSSGNSRRTVTCTGTKEQDNQMISELRWTNAGLKGVLSSLRPTWLSHIKILNLSGNPGLIGPFPIWLQDVENWKSLISL